MGFAQELWLEQMLAGVLLDKALGGFQPEGCEAVNALPARFPEGFTHLSRGALKRENRQGEESWRVRHGVQRERMGRSVANKECPYKELVGKDAANCRREVTLRHRRRGVQPLPFELSWLLIHRSAHPDSGI